jgi:hypothetical protein
MSQVTGNRSSLGIGLATGTVAALVGALVWALFIGVTHHELGLAATAIGLLVGAVMARTAGVDSRLPGLAAALALLGCVVGSAIGYTALQARAEGVGFGEALSDLSSDPGLVVRIFRDYFTPIDLLFWALAGLAAFRLVRGAVARHAAASVATGVATAGAESNGLQGGQPSVQPSAQAEPLYGLLGSTPLTPRPGSAPE